jgi:DNA-binding NarL/FixJ family response regulator
MNLAMPALFLGPSYATATAHALDRARAETRAAVATRRAVLVGSSDPHVSSLLTDVLRDMRLDVELLERDTQAPDVILAMVDRADGVRAITDARARFPRVPVVAILTLGTHRLGTRAVAAGASACYVLDMPIDRLRNLINAIFHAPAAAAKVAASEPARAAIRAR